VSAPFLIVVVLAAVALGASAVAVWLAWTARGIAVDARGRIARHQQEHRLGVEDEGLRRHRAVTGPSTEHLAAVHVAPGRAVVGEEPAEDEPAGPPPERYARLRRHAEQEAEDPTTVERPAADAPARRPLPPPGGIGRRQ
jgi:hypothetical protein